MFFKWVNVCNNKNCQIYRNWQEESKVQSKEIERAEIYPGEALGDRFGSKQAMAVSKEIRLQDNIFIIEHQWK